MRSPALALWTQPPPPIEYPPRMRTREDVEAYLAKSPYPFHELEENTWLVQDRSGAKENIVVRLSGDIVHFRVNVVDLASIDAARRGALSSRKRFMAAMLSASGGSHRCTRRVTCSCMATSTGDGCTVRGASPPRCRSTSNA